MDEPRVIEVTGELIRLGQLLKLAGVAASGADAAQLLASGTIAVDGEPETRRGRKLRDGAVVALGGGESLLVRTRA